MKRRQALRSMGSVFGYAVAAPTVLGILHSCESTPFSEWIPDFFSPEEGRFVARMLDVILPETDTPKATDLGLHQFVDGLFDQALLDPEKEFARVSTAHFLEAARQLSGKQVLDDITDEEIQRLLQVYLIKRVPEVEEAHADLLQEFIEALERGEEASINAEAASFIWAHQLRDIAIDAYRETRYIGEEVLAYLPVPGQYIPCEGVDKLTGGKAWSIGEW